MSGNRVIHIILQLKPSQRPSHDWWIDHRFSWSIVQAVGRPRSKGGHIELGPAYAWPWLIARRPKPPQWFRNRGGSGSSPTRSIRQGEKMIELPFVREEYQQRLAKIRAEMAR